MEYENSLIVKEIFIAKQLRIQYNRKKLEILKYAQENIPNHAGGETESDGKVSEVPVHHIHPFAFHAGDAAGKDL